MAVARSSRSIGAGGFAYVGGLKLPAGVTYSEYVHNGVDTLTDP